ncbi:MAG: arginase family protein [Proteobacteria bacterium]|nr:arginase family protein [Pseudomonadota bacterium]
MKSNFNKKMMFFGCPMDCDEKYDSIQEKRNGVWAARGFDDPLDGVMDNLGPYLPKDCWDNLGSLDVPSWLGPKPRSADHSKITTENFISFIDNNGCKNFADATDQFVRDQILPDIPCMVGIDHSLTGGVYSALSRHYGKDNLSLIIIDSHTDAVPMPVLAGAIQYDMDNNPSSVHDVNDPFLYNRSDSYNASSFVHSLVAEKQVDPKNLYIIGVSDYPEKKFLRIKDVRIKKYTNAYVSLKHMGTKIITKKECKLNPKKISGFFKNISTPYVYISIDMDIGANNALEGVRFRNWKGLNESQIYKLGDAVAQIFSDSIQLAGMDICEIDPRRAGAVYPSGKDQTYEIAANLIRKIAFNPEHQGAITPSPVNVL